MVGPNGRRRAARRGHAGPRRRVRRPDRARRTRSRRATLIATPQEDSVELAILLAIVAVIVDRPAADPVPVGPGRAAVREDGRLPARADERVDGPRAGPPVPRPDHRPAGQGRPARAVHRGPEPDDDHQGQRPDQRRLPDLLADRRPAQERRQRRELRGRAPGRRDDDPPRGHRRHPRSTRSCPSASRSTRSSGSSSTRSPSAGAARSRPSRSARSPRRATSRTR